LTESTDSGNFPRPAIAGKLLLLYLLAIVYVSLSPFVDWRIPQEPFLSYLWAPLPKYLTHFDILVNIFAYVPFGALLDAYWRRYLATRPALLVAIGCGVVLSLAMETAQAFLPSRIANNLDIATNSIGVALGALLWAALASYGVGREWVGRVRRRLFLHGAGVDTGIALLVIWLISQLNPSIPFLGAGVVNNPLTDPWDMSPTSPLALAPQVAGEALNLSGAGLYVTVLMQRRLTGFVLALVLVLAAFMLKALAASLLLKPVLFLDWMGPETLVGIGLGLLLLAACAALPLRIRIYFAAVFILSGAIISKIAGRYTSLTDALKLFSWPYGQLLNFTGLTLYLNEVWPFLALIFLVSYFPSRSRGKS
jgi:VanZ family protein